MSELHKVLYDRYRDDTIRLKCKQYAKWTLPKLMADVNMYFAQTPEQLERDYQEIGPLLVNNLATKLAALLFPANRSFFKGELSADARKVAQKKLSKTQMEELDSTLAAVEAEACARLFINASYNQLVLLCCHLIVTGNALLYRDSKNRRLVCYGLQQIAVRRDGQGVAVDTLLKEEQYFDSLPLSIQMQLNNSTHYGKQYKFDSVVEVYTRIHRVATDSGFVYEVSQQIDNIDVGQSGSYPEHLCPWRTVVWSIIPGEHYGRGLVEDYAGGFAKLSDSSQAAELYTLEMLKLVNLVEPGQGVDIDHLAESETGEYVQGKPGAVMAHETGSSDKLKIANDSIERTEMRLARAFMYTGNTRNAERVTMYELQQQAREAETTLGGAYSVLSEQIQVPLAHILVDEVKPELFAGIITDTLRLEVIAGLPALGRASDVQNLVAAAQDASAIVGVLSQVDKRLSVPKVMDTVYRGYSIDKARILLDTDEQETVAKADAEQAQAQAGITAAASLADQQQALSNLQQGQV